jgi:Rps23 Pro-64 3,4-dihydroxylase Tpa1-like proline 4-hydroxylase
MTGKSKYILARDMNSRMVSRDSVEVQAGGDPVVLPLTWYLILLKFTEPRSLEHACAAFGIDLKQQPDLERALTRLRKARVLRSNDENEHETKGILDLLDPAVFSNRANRTQIAAALRAGRLVVIKNAFREKLARQVHRALSATRHWKPHESFAPGFFYHHHNLYDRSAWPAVLRTLESTFATATTRSFIADLSQQDCSGDPVLSASLFLPGDHQLPHHDFGYDRTVAYVWHLTENWDSEWGGALYWCPTGTTFMPTFNTLFLFVVSSRSEYLVTKVSPHARGRRLAVNGWWRGTAGQANKPSQTPGQAYALRAKRICGGRVEVI